MSASIYRVVVSENRKTGTIYIDLANAKEGVGFHPTHDYIRILRCERDPDAESLTDGLLLYDFGDNNLRLKHDFVTNKKLKAYQDAVIARYQNDIFKTYQAMRDHGAESTLKADSDFLARICSDALLKSATVDPNQSAVTQRNIEAARHQKTLEEKRAELRTRTKRHSFDDPLYRQAYYNNRSD